MIATMTILVTAFGIAYLKLYCHYGLDSISIRKGEIMNLDLEDTPANTKKTSKE